VKPEQRKHVIELPWSMPPLSMNDRGHWAPRASRIAQVRETGYWLAKNAKMGSHQRVRIELHYRPKAHRGRDSDNLAATYKPLVDGITDAHLVPDDTDRYVERDWPKIHEPIPGEAGRLWLEITILEAGR
jgi:crossover junction endodeoxyribonuclease RusA